MIKRIGKGLFVIAILSAMFILFQNKNLSIENPIQSIKNISNIDAENVINNQYLNYEDFEESFEDTIYSVVKIDINHNSSLHTLMVKNGYPFYVFQNNHLIYSQEKNTYYHGKSIEEEKYYISNTELWKNQGLHQIPLHSNDPLYILIRKEKNKQISDFISMPEINGKNIQNLINTDIPIIKINTHNNPLDTTEYKFTSAQILSNNKNIPLLSKMKIRGNSSLSFPKKQFNIIFEEKNKLNQLELNKNVLISSYNDRSLMRNKIAHDLFSLFKSNKSSSEYVHLIINDSYEGLYLITDHPEQQFNQLISDTTTLNFLAQIDRGPFNFYGGADKTGYKIECIDNVRKASTPIHYFEKFIIWNPFEEVNGYGIDTHSFIDFIILNELSKNIDAYRLSTYLSFINKKVSMDIIWDFDLAFGLANYNEGYNHEGFVIESVTKDYIPFFWHVLWDNELIQEKLKKRYQELRKDILSNDNIDNYINELYNQINISAKNNFERWEIIGKDIWPNKFNFKSHKEEVEYLREWTHKRIEFLDSKWN